MTITVDSTTKTVEFSGIPCRIWEGHTASGIAVHVYVPRIAVAIGEPNLSEFDRDLKECRAPSAAVEAIPLRMIL